MKKFLALVIVVAMTLTLAVNVFATTTGSNATVEGALSNPDDIPVYINTKTPPTATKYKIDIQWEALDFTYTTGYQDDWNPSTHLYVDKDASGWDKDEIENAITVTNHSNAIVNVSATAVDANDSDSVTIGVTGNAVALPSAVGKDTDDSELTTTYGVTVNGIPSVRGSDIVAANVKITLS